MTDKEKEQCGNCRFYNDKDTECRRYPPTVIGLVETRGRSDVIDTHPWSTYPSTVVNEWCGEWSDKNGK